MSTLAADTIARAANVEHAWDRRAIEWDDLTPSSIVVEVGGYTGRWALQIAERYGPKLFVFEPQGWAAEVCREVLGDRATVLEYALGTQSATLYMGAWGTDGCSFVNPGSEHEGDMVEIGAAYAALGLARVDLMLMNIEGYEYTLLPHMIARGLLPDRLMVQWHPPNGGEAQHDALLAAIERTHRRLWDYGAVLMAWERGV